MTCADAAFPVLLGPSQSWCPGPAAHVYNTVVECACTSTGGNVELFCGQSCRGSGNTYCHGGPISTDCLQCLEGYCGAYVTACQMY